MKRCPTARTPAGRGCCRRNPCPSRMPTKRPADAAAKKAAADSAAANVGRLRELESFKRVVAPFAGVITARNTDIGALINAGQSAGTELFRIADTRKTTHLRASAANFRRGSRGRAWRLNFIFPSSPVSSIPRKPCAHRMRSIPRFELCRWNSNSTMARARSFPGPTRRFTSSCPPMPTPLRLPANTVLFRAQGLQVATVDDQRRVKLKSIVQGRDFGGTIEVLSGLEPSDNVVVNPPDSLSDGAEVRIAQPAVPTIQGHGQDDMNRALWKASLPLLGALTACSPCTGVQEARQRVHSRRLPGGRRLEGGPAGGRAKSRCLVGAVSGPGSGTRWRSGWATPIRT